MANPTYTSQQADFIKEFVGSDSELTIAFNRMFDTNISKSAMRKKRQRMGVARTPAEFRIAWMTLIGENNEGIERSLRDHPPVDIYAEQLELSAARRGEWVGLRPSELLGDAPVDI